MDNSIQKIRDACDILSVVSQYVQLKRAGRNYKGLCPFHGEKTPSFMVSPDKQIFHCFGCGKGGDVIKFVQEYERLNFREALEMLAKRAGIELPRSPAKARARDEREQIYAVNAEAARFYVDFLRHPKNGRIGRDYLEKRAIRPDTVDRFRLGLAPAGWGELLSHLTAKGFSPEDCERGAWPCAAKRARSTTVSAAG
jgi:DNA primase